MFGLGIGEVAVILFVALIFIGPKKLPELAKGLGKGIREFQNAARGLQETIKNPPASNEQDKLDNPPLPEHEGDKGHPGPVYLSDEDRPNFDKPLDQTSIDPEEKLTGKNESSPTEESKNDSEDKSQS
jgi:TatA/E family protein of Tat protein translocase